MTRRLAIAAFVTGAALAASSCSMMEKAEPPPCPRVSILADAAKTTKFRPGPGRDLTDVVVNAEIGAFTGSCSYKDDAVEVALQVSIDAERGPASAAGKPVDLAYFVAIPAYFPSPKAKAVLPVQVAFPEAANTVRFTDEEVVMTIPLNGEYGDKYEIFLGFQMSGDELDYNRETKR